MTALLIEIVSSLVLKSRSLKNSLKTKEREDAENIFLSLVLNKTPLTFFENLAKTKHKALKNSHYIKILHEDYNVILFPILKLEKITSNDLIEILKRVEKEKLKKIVVVCYDYDSNILTLLKSLPCEFVLLDKYEAYQKLYKYYNFYPEIQQKYNKNKKENFKELIRFSFQKNKTKNYLISSIVILFSSIFVRLNIYYCIVSSLLLIFAIISFFSPFDRKKEAQNFEL